MDRKYYHDQSELFHHKTFQRRGLETMQMLKKLKAENEAKEAKSKEAENSKNSKSSSEKESGLAKTDEKVRKALESSEKKSSEKSSDDISDNKETNEDEKNESGNIFFLVLDSWYSPALVRGSLLPFLAHEVGVPDYESINTADDSTLDPKPKKGTRRSRRKSCTDVKVICSIYRLYMTRHGFRVSFEPKIRL